MMCKAHSFFSRYVVHYDKYIIVYKYNVTGFIVCLLECSLSNPLFLFSHIREVQLEKGVTSIAIRGEGQQFFVGTEAAQMYRFSYDNFKAELISTSHNSAVKDVAICL